MAVDKGRETRSRPTCRAWTSGACARRGQVPAAAGEPAQGAFHGETRDRTTPSAAFTSFPPTHIDDAIAPASCLNRASALVWEACDGKKTTAQITETVNRKLESPVNEEFVWLALDLLRKDNLIANSDAVAPTFNGLSRRHVMRRIGTSMLVALPLITSVAAPPPAYAQSATCAPATPCACIGLGNVSSCTAALGGCGAGCVTCIVNASCFLPGGEGALVCPGVCAGPPV